MKIALLSKELKIRTKRGRDNMRKPERLDEFYDTLKEIHKKSFCDMRFGQFMIVVFGWIQQTKGRDPFFPEEDEMIKLIKEYANTTSMWFREN